MCRFYLLAYALFLDLSKEPTADIIIIVEIACETSSKQITPKILIQY